MASYLVIIYNTYKWATKRKGETKDAFVLGHWNQGPDNFLTSQYYNSSKWYQHPLLRSRGNCISVSYSSTYFVSLANTTSVVFLQDSLNYPPSIFTLSPPVLSIKYKQMPIIMGTKKSMHNAESFPRIKHLFSNACIILKS